MYQVPLLDTQLSKGVHPQGLCFSGSHTKCVLITKLVNNDNELHNYDSAMEPFLKDLLNKDAWPQNHIKESMELLGNVSGGVYTCNRAVLLYNLLRRSSLQGWKFSQNTSLWDTLGYCLAYSLAECLTIWHIDKYLNQLGWWYSTLSYLCIGISSCFSTRRCSFGLSAFLFCDD